MAEAPTHSESSRPMPGDSIANRLFARGATRASVGPSAEFYHRLGVDDPYSMTSGAAGEGDQGPFTYLSSGAYFRDLRRSRLGLLSRLSGNRPIDRVGRRAQRIGPAAAMVRPSALAKLAMDEAAFELLDDPMWSSVEEEPQEVSWKTKPRAPKQRQAAVRERIVYRPMQQAMSQVGGDVDELTRMLARALQSVRGAQRGRLEALISDVRNTPPEKREATVRKSMRRLRGPMAAVLRDDAAEMFEGQRVAPAAVAKSRGSDNAKGLRRTLGASPSLLVLAQAEQEESAIELDGAVPRRRAARGRTPRSSKARSSVRTEQSRPSARSVSRVVDVERADVGLSRAGTAAAQGIARIVSRERSGLVDEHESAPVTRAATGHLGRKPVAPRRLSRAFPETVLPQAAVDHFAEGDLAQSESVAPRVRRRAAPTARVARRAALVRDSEVAQSAAPLAKGRVAGTVARSLSPLADRVAPARRETQARRMRRAPVTVSNAAQVAQPDAVRVVPESNPTTPRRRVDVVRKAQTRNRALSMVPEAMVEQRKPLTRHVATERMVARSEAVPHAEGIAASPVRYARPVATETIFARRFDTENEPAESVEWQSTPVRRPRPAAAAVSQVRKAASSVLPRTQRERPTVRVARRGVSVGAVRADGDSTFGAVSSDLPRSARQRSVLPAPTSYLVAPPEAVAAEITEPTARRVRGAMAPVASAQGRKRDTAVQVQGVARRAIERSAVEEGAEADRPMFRAARRAVEAPVQSLAATVLPTPTAYLSAPVDDVVDDQPALAPRKARRARVSEPGRDRLEMADVGGAAPPVEGAAAKILLRADPDSVDSPADERVVARGEHRAEAARAPRRLAGIAAAAVLVQPEAAPDVAESIPARPMVRAARRAATEVRRDEKGRATLGVDVASAARPVRRRPRATVPPSAAPTARSYTRLGAPTQRTVSPRPAPRFEWAMLLPELVAASEQPSIAPTRKVRRGASEAVARPVPRRDRSSVAAPTAAEEDAAPLSLVDVASRTRSAVRAMQRPEQSVLSFDATRRTFGESVAPRAHTVEARVELDAQGRVRRVVAKRLATGEQVFLSGDDVIEALPASQAAGPRRPSQGAWVEERAAVGRARPSVRGDRVQREAPGARLVERSAVPDVSVRLARRNLDLPALSSTLAMLPDGDATTVQPVGGPRQRRPVSQAVSRSERMFHGEQYEAVGPAMAQRSAGLVAGLGPVTLAAAALPSDTSGVVAAEVTAGRRGPRQPAVARRSAVERRRMSGATPRATRPVLGNTLAALSNEPVHRRRRKAAVAGEPEWLDDEAFGEEAPSWAQRASDGGIGSRTLPDIFSKPRVRTSGGLLTALARAGDAEEVVRVILQRSGDLDASMMPVGAQRLLFRVADEAGAVARQVGRSERAMRDGATVAPQTNTVVRNILEPASAGRQNSFGPRSRTTTTQGVGASKVMKLANKLMKLIHLAESDGRGDAHKQVRMAENSSEARAESGKGATSGEQLDEKTMNIKALRRDVLDAVLRALDDLRWRREDPDGPSIWC